MRNVAKGLKFEAVCGIVRIFEGGMRDDVIFSKARCDVFFR